MSALLENVRAALGERVLEAREDLGECCVVVERESAASSFERLRDDPALAFGQLTDLTVVDYPGRKPRFDVVSHLFSLDRLHRLRVKVRCGDGADCWAPTISAVWKNANWLEREAWDMFGVDFRGHPDQRRILMYEEFEGHPLRKDYPVMRRQPIIPERDPVENPWPERELRPRR